MAEPESPAPAQDPVAAPVAAPEPPALPVRPNWRERAARGLARARKPLVAVAAVGTVLSGLVGYWTTWRVVHTGVVATPAAPSQGGARGTVAVLPFASLSQDKSDEHFADGVTEELIELLSRVRGLRVAPRGSSFHFKGQAVPAAEAARQLGAAHLVEGSVRRAEERVRISAQLVNAADGKVIWSRSFDREFKDVLALQAEIAIGIAGSLVPSLDPKIGLSGSGTRSPEAWQAYLDTRRLPEGQREAALQRVLAMDPKFARIHTELAEGVLAKAAQRKLPLAAAREQMARHLEAALRADPRDDHAWGLKGAAAQLADDVEELRRVAQGALEVNPDSTSGSGWSAELKLLDGDISAALPLFRHQADRLPLVEWARNHHVQALRLAHRPAQALAAAEQVLALEPENEWGLGEKVLCLLALGRRDEALALARERNFNRILIRYGTPQDQAALRHRKDVSAHAAAWRQFAEGQPDAMVEHLEAEHSLVQERNRVLFDPEYDPLRELPAFKAWLEKHELTAAHERAQAWRAANPVQRN